MKGIFDSIRTPEKDIPLIKQILSTVILIALGFALGVLQKWIDASDSDILPVLLQKLDIRNYFGRLSIWILLATIISIYSRSPIRASINTFLFFISMLAGYYLYSHYILGFLSKSYLMIWITISFASIFLAYICWYAKGSGMAAIIISALITGVLLAQAFSIIQGFYMYDLMDALTWMAGVIILRRKPKEFAVEFGLSIIVAAVYQLFVPYYG